MNNKIKGFIKKQIAKALSIAMCVSTIATSGMAVSTAYADPASVTVTNGQEFIADLVDIAASGTPYVWGGSSRAGVDCAQYVRLALKEVYGNAVFHLVSDPSVAIEVTNTTSYQQFNPYVGQEFYIEGNGLRCYYVCDVSSTQGSTNGIADIKVGEYGMSSLISYAQQFPGTIIVYNGHAGVGMGTFGSKAEVLNKYPSLNRDCSGADVANMTDKSIVRFFDSHFELGNSYPTGDLKNYFGKTMFIAAGSTKNGIRMSNASLTGKTPYADNGSAITILRCKSEPPKTKIVLEKYSREDGQPVYGAWYGMYKDPACTQIMTLESGEEVKIQMTPEEDYVVVQRYATYYFKELQAPTGYELSPDVITVYANQENMVANFYDNATKATLMVRKVDARDSSIVLNNTEIVLAEWNGTDYIDVATLEFNDILKAFILTSYRDVAGTTWNDGELHYTKTNGGYFKLYEKTAQPGYMNEGWSAEFNIETDPAPNFVQKSGDHAAVTNKALLALKIVKKDENGNPMQGVQFKFDYNGVTYTGSTDANGLLVFPNMVEGPTSIGTLYEVATLDGYQIPESLKNGKQIALTKEGKATLQVSGITFTNFMTEVQVTNHTTPQNEYYGKLKFQKKDGTRFDIPGAPVIGAIYNVYADEACTTIATDVTGNKLENIVSSDTPYVSGDLYPGYYFIKEIQAPNQYGIQLKTFMVNITGTQPNEIVTVRGVADDRQLVQLNINKVDAVTSEPIANAVFALYSNSDLWMSSNTSTIAAGTLLGYYKTDEKGEIKALMVGMTDPVVGPSGTTYFTDSVLNTDGVDMTLDALVNGSYKLVEVEAPEGYVLDSNPIIIDAPYCANNTPDAITHPQYPYITIGPEGNSEIVNTTVFNQRQTISITLQKTDLETAQNTAKGHYDVTNYDATNPGYMATLYKASYALIAAEDFYTVSGEQIRAGESLGIYETDANGKIVMTEYKRADLANKAIVPAHYTIKEVSPSVGYALNTNVIDVDMAALRPAGYKTMYTYNVNVDTTEEILKQPLKITKLDGSNNTIDGIEFSLYSVSEICDKAGITKDAIPLAREAFEALIANNGINPKADENGDTKFTTGADGTVTTAGFVYDDYVLYEVYAKPGYTPCDAELISLPLVETEANIEGTSPYIHIVTEQPTVPYEVTVYNFANLLLKVIKVDENGAAVTSDSAEFVLTDANGNVVTQTLGGQSVGNPWKTGNDGSFVAVETIAPGTYTLKETKAPNGYALSNNDIEITFASNSVTAVDKNGSTVNVEKETDASGNLVAVIKFSNTPNSISVLKTYNNNGTETPLAGAVLQLLDASGNVATTINGEVCEWTTTEEAKVIKGLAPGTYKVHEKSAPKGYALASDVAVTVTSSSSAATTVVKMEDKPIQISIQKVDATNNSPIKGATLQVLDASTNEVAKDIFGNKLEWVSDGTTKIFKNVPAGNYKLHESVTPLGYQVSSDIDFTVVNTTENVQAVTAMRDARTFGMINIHKVDSKTSSPLKGVEFQLISVNDVVDPVSGATIYTAGQVVDTLPATNADGNTSLTKTVPIGVYAADGTFTYIDYKIKETKAPAGQYELITTGVINFTYVNDTTPVVEMNLNLENTKPTVVVSKTGAPTTFVGSYENKTNVTVVDNGDTLTYTISVTNNSLAKANGIVVRDAVPANSTLISADNNAIVENKNINGTDTTIVYWVLDEVSIGETVELHMEVKVNNPNACEIVNIAEYTMPDFIPTPSNPFDYKDPSIEWDETEAVVHQVVEFHKTSKVIGGDKVTNAVPVTIGEKITYTLTFKSVDDVYALSIDDKIPEGLTYVSGTAKINGTVDNGATYNPSTRVITFSEQAKSNGTVTCSFDVTVDYIEVGTSKTFENVAFAHLNRRDGQSEKKDIESEHIFHRVDSNISVVKSGTPKTYEGPAKDAHDLTALKKSDKIEYTITIKNDGKSTAKNIVVTDTIPEGTTNLASSITQGVEVYYNEMTKTFTWFISELPAGKSFNVGFSVKVNDQTAKIIDNKAYYDTIPKAPTPGTPPTITPEKETNDVIHQVVEFHKTSDVLGGSKGKTDATPVASGDTIIYTMSFVSKADVTGVIVSDEIPEGLTFKPGSIQYKKAGDSNWTNVTDAHCVNNNGVESIVFPEIDVPAGTSYFRFNVTVNRIPVNTEKFFINQAVVEYDKETGNPNSAKDKLLSEEISHMTNVSIKGHKTTTSETFVGAYNSRANVTVVKPGDTIDYSISVKNEGISALTNVVIKDTVPVGTELIKEEKPTYTYDEKTRTLTWTIDKLEAGKTAEVKFNVKVTVANNTAAEIVNVAKYAVPVDPKNIKDDEWIKTEEVVHQLVEFHKTSSIAHGKDKTDAPKVDIGSTFSYILTFKCVDDVYNVSIFDNIPVGLEYVPGTAKLTVGNQTTNIKTVHDSATNKLTFDTIPEVKAGTITIKFDVKVKDVEKYDTDYFFINQAFANVNLNKTSTKAITLPSELVSHKTNKTNKTITPVLGFETTNPSRAWSVIAFISMIGMITFGYYGFFRKSKKK